MAGTFTHTARPSPVRRHKRRAYLHAIETLETRQLMDADLLPVFVQWGPSFDAMIQRDPTNATVRVGIKNINAPSTAVPPSTSVDVKVFSRPQGALDNTQDILVNKSAFNLNVSNLATNSSKNADVPVVLTNLPGGNYIFVAQVDSANVLTEVNETNNYTTNNVFDFTVIPRPNDLRLSIDPSNPSYTKALISDGTTKSTIKVQVRNFDTVGTAANQMATFTVVAHRVSDDQEFTLPAIAPVKLGAIAPNKSKPITLTETLPLGMEGGEYVFKVSMTTDIPSDGTSNNTDQTLSFNASRGFVDLVTNITSVNITSPYVAGTTQKGTMKVDLTNTGNVPLPTTQHVNLTAYLHATNSSDNSADIVIGQTLNLNIAKLGPNSLPSHPHKPATIGLTVFNNVNPNDYVYIVKATPVESLTEESLANNSQSGSTLTIQTAQADLQMSGATVPFGNDSAGGDSGIGTMTVSNLSGNVTALGSVTVTFYATTGSTIDGNATAIGHTTISNFSLAPGKTAAPIKVALTLPNPGSTTAYHILAKVTFDEGNVVTETNPADNTSAILATTTTTHATSLWGNFAAPSVIKFVADNTIGFHTGKLYDTVGNLIGTYEMTVPGANPHTPKGTNVLGLTFTGQSPLGSNPVFTGAEFYFSGKTITFSLSPTGAKGSFVIGGGVSQTIYFK